MSASQACGGSARASPASWRAVSSSAAVAAGSIIAAFTLGALTAVGALFLIGALIMAVLTNGLRVLSVAPEWQTVVTGAIIIVAVYADQLHRGRAG